MGIKLFYKIVTILLGYGLVIGGYLLFGASLSDRVRVLDIIVSCVVLTQFVEFFLFPFVDTNKDAHKEIGMMGIHFVAIDTYIVLAIAVIGCGILWNWSFTIQMMLQGAALLILLVGRVLTLHAGDKVEQVYGREKYMMSGKLSMKGAMTDLLDAVSLSGALNEGLANRLKELQDNVRFIAPSASSEASRMEGQIIETAQEIEVLLRDVELNADKLEEDVAQMERLFARRKSL